MNRTKGSITIFLCLVITVIMSLVCTVVESARVHAARSYARSLTYMAMEYQFANYARQVFEDYGLLTIWEQGDIKEEIKNYINRSNNKVDLSDEALDMSQLTVSNLDNSQFERVTDNGGDAMVNQILDYEKYEISGVLVTEFLNVLQSQNAIDEDFSLAQEYLNSNASEEFDNAKTDENQQLVLDLEEAFLEIKDADISGWKLDFDETDNKVKKTFKNLKNSLEELQEFIDEINPKILEYENLGKGTVNGEYSSEDWIAQNINYVKNIDEKNESTLEYLEQAITGMDNNVTEEEKVKIVDNISQNLSDMCIYQEQLATTEATTDDEQSKNLFLITQLVHSVCHFLQFFCTK